jgi:aspartyl-tRNA(Asn)/glutamyl-tRNA(Gln) amidotransferase subunit A
VGLKQTFGRVSQRGLLVTSFNGDHIGPLTRSVLDSALVLQVIAGYDPLDPSTVPVPVPDYSAALGHDVRGLQMGIPANYYYDLLDAEVEVAVRRAIEALEAMGVAAKTVTLPSMRYAGALRIAALADSVVTHEPYLAEHRQDYGPEVLYRTLAGQFVLGRDYSKALKVQRLIKEDHARVLQEVDFLVTPTAPVAAPRIDAPTLQLGETEYRVRGPGSGLLARCTNPSNATGLPAITVPCGFTQAGLPIGIQFIGRPFDEARLLQVAYAYEAVSPSQGRRPALAGS